MSSKIVTAQRGFPSTTRASACEHAGGGTRTLKGLLPPDFECPATPLTKGYYTEEGAELRAGSPSPLSTVSACCPPLRQRHGKDTGCSQARPRWLSVLLRGESYHRSDALSCLETHRTADPLRPIISIHIHKIETGFAASLPPGSRFRLIGAARVSGVASGTKAAEVRAVTQHETRRPWARRRGAGPLGRAASGLFES